MEVGTDQSVPGSTRSGGPRGSSNGVPKEGLVLKYTGPDLLLPDVVVWTRRKDRDGARVFCPVERLGQTPVPIVVVGPVSNDTPNSHQSRVDLGSESVLGLHLGTGPTPSFL